MIFSITCATKAPQPTTQPGLNAPSLIVGCYGIFVAVPYTLKAGYLIMTDNRLARQPCAKYCKCTSLKGVVVQYGIMTYEASLPRYCDHHGMPSTQDELCCKFDSAHELGGSANKLWLITTVTDRVASSCPAVQLSEAQLEAWQCKYKRRKWRRGLMAASWFSQQHSWIFSLA